MALDVWSEFKEQVRVQTDIVSLIAESRNVIPIRGGREYKALCPFHDDHDPSMSINPERQTYRCWVCDAAGDVFSYVMKLEGLDFKQTLNQLAERAGLELPQASRVKRQPQGLGRQDQLEVLEWACEQFHQCLLFHPEGNVAREYLLDRGFSEETWMDFRLGFHPGPWEWLLKRGEGKFKVALMEAAGLVNPRQTGDGYFDFFRNRVMFPVCNERGQVIAFGGRALPGSDDLKFGKYQNSREGTLFHKSRQLYGIDRALEAMRDQKRVIVVEGYTDCIALHQQGIANVVATLGTALTQQHVELIRRFCKEVLLVFDGDQAGQKAAQRALPILLSYDLDLKLFALPEGMDPPEYLERHGLQEFQNLLQNADDAWEFKLSQLHREHGVGTSHSREQIIEGMLELLSVAPGISGTPRENHLLNRLANRVGLKGLQEHVLHKKLQDLRRKGPRIAHNPATNSTNQQEPPLGSPPESFSDVNYEQHVKSLLKDRLQRIPTLERDLLEICLTLPECITLIGQRGLLGQIQDPLLAELLELCDTLHREQRFSGPETLLTSLEDPDLKQLVTGLVSRMEARKIAEKLQDWEETPQGDTMPRLLLQVVDQLEWEHKESHHRNSTRQAVIPNGEPAPVDDRARQLLQDAALFHQQRVTRKTASN